ncbi:PPK2 family polyphosphate kinase [Gluconobacter japonicus]|uniref:Polyphosphate kinase 2 family protein n=1 Tax=Gluconobacter japonicus TaxID=376620 RepID=A0A9Q2FPA4_GLUJA|nr:PPK2 family polyphosphate kinase [Gluconobacter japonicus]MBF0872001.1 polyphosphate kinase 2 family protein [Gluconobacter japonicus]
MSAETGVPSRLKITDGSKFHLSDFKTDDRVGHDKKSAHTRIRDCVDRMAILQGRLAAHGSHGILVVLQGMDTAGKDGAIRHAFSGLNPQGFHVTSFKTPAGPAEKRDDLWRVHLMAPARGEIAVFNRSHYEDVLIARVHPDFVRARGLDPDTPGFWDKRLSDIRHFESYLTHQNIVVLKLFLHISANEQKKRILKRLTHPEKRWKFSPSDLAEREKWPDYTQAYEAAIQATATPEAPWHIIPADHKWAARLMVAEALLEVLEGLHLKVPEEKLSDALRTARDTLLAEGSQKP